MKGFTAREKLIVASMAALSLYMRLAHRALYLDSWDAVDFTLGVQFYNLSLMQPHPPGYPIYILLGKLFSLLTGDPVSALSLLSSVSGALSLVPLYFACRFLWGIGTALSASLIFLCSPLPSIVSAKILSDAPALLFLLMSVMCMARGSLAGGKKNRHYVFASIFLALTLGIRASYAPFALLLLFPLSRDESKKTKGLVLLFFTATLAAWASFMLVASGLSGSLAAIRNFAAGHFTSWGGTVLTHSNPLSRLRAFIIDDIAVSGMGFDLGWGFPFLLAAAAGLSGYLWHLRSQDYRGALLLYCLPAGLWIFLGQNLDSPRHVLPLVPALAAVFACGWTTIMGRLKGKTRVVLPALIAFSLVILGHRSLAATRELHSARPPVVELAEFIKANYDPDDTIIFSWESERVIHYYAPPFIIVRANEPDIEGGCAGYYYGDPEHVLITGDALEEWLRRDSGSLPDLASIKLFSPGKGVLSGIAWLLSTEDRSLGTGSGL